MRDHNLSRDELLAELGDLRRRVEELEAENFSLRKENPAVTEGPLKETSNGIDPLFRSRSPELPEIENDYRSVVESASEAICITKDGVLKFVNPAGSRLTGYAIEDLISMPFSALTHSEDIEELERLYVMRLRDEYVPPGRRFRIVVKSGDAKWVESSSSSITWKGRPAVLSMIREVTEQVHAHELLQQSRDELQGRIQQRTAELEEINEKLVVEIVQREQAEKALRESEKRFRTLAEASFEGIAVSEKGTLLDANDQLATMLGSEAGELIGKEVLEFISPEHVELVARAQRTGRLGPYEHLMLRKDGTEFPVEVRARWAHVKDRQVRITAIRDITERRRVEETLRETNAVLEALIQGSPAAVIALDPDGNVKLWNPAAEVMSGWSEAEALGRNLPYVPEDKIDECQTLLEDVLRGSTFRGVEVRRRKKDGSPIDLSISAGPLHDAKGNISGIMTIGIDITERKRAEQKLRFTQFAIDNSADAAFWLRSDGLHTYVNDAACRSLGYSREELLGLYVQDIDPNYPKEKWEEHWRETKQSGSCIIETHHKRKDGRLFPVEVRINFVEFEGQEYHCTFASDITERKQAEQALQDSVEKFRSIVENSLAGIFTVDDAYRFVYANEELCRILGYPRDQLLGLDFREVLTDEGRALVVDRYIRRQRGEEVPSRYEIYVVRADGGIRHVEMTVAVVRDASGRSLSMGQLIDITERKRTEEALRAKTEELDLFFTAALDLLCVADTDGYFRRLNPEWQTVLGYPLAELEGKRFFDLVHPEDLEATLAAVSRLASQESVLNFTNRYRRQDGSYRWIEWRSYPAGKVVCAAGRDITERRRTEELLRENLIRLQTMVRNAPIVLFGVDRRGIFTLSEGKGLLAMGLKPGEGVGRSVFDVYRDQPDIQENFRRALAGEAFTALVQAGTHAYDAYHEPVFGEDGEYNGTLGVLVDVTERRQAEERLRLTQFAVDHMADGAFWMREEDARFFYVNDAACRDMGYSRDEFLTMTVFDIDPLFTMDDWIASNRELRTKKSRILETAHKAKNGRVYPVEIRANLMEFGGKEYICSFARDITERKVAEEALRQANLVIENSPVVVFRWRATEGWPVATVSHNVIQFGYTPEELLSGEVLFASMIHRDDLDRVLREVQEYAAAGTDAFQQEYRIVTKSVGVRWVDDRTVVERDADGQIVFYQGIVIDITERKIAEQALRESEERLRLAWDTSPDYFSISRLNDGFLVDVNNGFTKLTGYARDEVVGRSAFEFGLWADPEDRPKLISVLTRDREVRDFETKFLRKDGEIRTVSISAGLMSLDGQPHILAIVKDIEESKRAQEALALSEELFRKYFELGLVGMALTSPEKGWVHVNDRICEMLGFSREELMQTTWTALTHPDDLGPDLAQFNRMLAGKIEGYYLDKRFVRKDGELVFTTLHVSCIRKADGTVEHVISHLHDITDRKRAEGALRKSEQLLRQVLDTIPVRLFWKDAESVYLGCNRLFASDSGLQSPEDLVGRTDFDMGWSEQAQLYRDDDRQVMESGTPKFNYEEPQTTPEGSRIWLRTSKVPLLDPDGRIRGVLGTYEDITERKLSEEALRRSEERYASIIAATQDGIFDWDLVSGFGYASERWYEIHGLSGANISSIDGWKRCVHADDVEQVEQSAQDHVAGRTPLSESEYRIRNAHGHEKWVLARAKAAFDAQGHAIRMIGTVTDITERKKAQLALHASEERYRAFVANTTEGIWRFELDQPVATSLPIEEQIEQIFQHAYLAECNDATARMYGLNRSEELIGMRWKDVAGNDSRNIEFIRAFIQSGYRLVEAESLETDREGNARRFMNSMVGLLENAHIVRAWGVQRDITEQKRAEEALREANLVVERSPVVLFRWRATEGWPVAIVSKNVIQFGYTQEELLSGAVRFASMVHPQDLDRVFREVQEYSASGAVRFQQEYRIITKDGEVRWVDDNTVVERDDDGQIVFYQGTVIDITERKKVEERLQEKETLLESILDASPVGINYVRNRQILWSNRAWEKMFGFEHPNEYVGKSSRILYQSDEEYESAAEAYYRAIRNDITTEFDATLRHTDGSVFSGNVRVRLMQKSHPDKFEAVVAVSDISNRKKAEEALKTSRHRLDQIIEFLPDPTVVIDDKGRVEAWNRAMEHLTGVAAESIIGRGNFEHALPFYGVRRPILLDFALNWDEGYLDKYISIARREDGLLISESYHPTLKGGIFLSGAARALYDSTGQTVGAIESLRDVTEIKKADEENLRLKKYVENIINSMPSLLVGVDRECRVTQWNNTAESLTGVSAGDARGKMLSDALPMLTNQLESVQRAICDRAIQSNHKVLRSTESGTRYDDITVYPLASNGVEGAVIRVDDVTERVRIEEMMVQTEKMMSVGGLAAGMAHEINNPLGVIMQATQNVLRRLSPELPANVRAAEECGLPFEALKQYLDRREIVTFLEDIRSSGKRAADVVSNMLSFSRKSEKGGSSESLSELLDRTLELAASDYDLKKKYDFRQIEIVREYDPDAPSVVCQAGKIQQVFLNILRNGAEAMQEIRPKGGVPRFILRVCADGDMVRVEIEDNGPGMDESIRRRVFEPFFTTKAPGVGTGLGMSVSYFIISEDHGGTMEVESSPGHGARFVIQLPVQGRTS